MRVLQVAARMASLAGFALPLMERLRGQGYEVEALGDFDGFESRLRDAGFPIHSWRCGHTFSPLAIWGARRELAAFLADHHYDLIHTHVSFAGIIANPVAFPRTPCLLYTQHGFYVHEGLSPLARRAWLAIEKIGLRWAHHVICVSQAEKQLAETLGVGPPSKFHFIPGVGVNLSRFQFPSEQRQRKRAAIRRSLGIGPDDTVILTVSRLTWDKGYRELIEAARAVASPPTPSPSRRGDRQPGVPLTLPGTATVPVAGVERGEPSLTAKQRQHHAAAAATETAALPGYVNFLAAGSGKDERAIRASINRAGLSDRFILLGWRDDVPDLYCAADLFVFASHREGLPVAPIEAMASGLPVIASDLPGCREEVEHEQSGLLYRVGDAGALTDAIRRLLAAPDLAAHLAAAGRTRAAAFSLDAALSRQLELYAEFA